ncbi:hypothetical protein C481_05190, partial [Natrialba asiatica DSM 12278]
MLGLGAASLGVVAGCLDETPGTASADGPNRTDGGDGNGNGNGKMDGEFPPCPDYGDSVDRVVCYDDV